MIKTAVITISDKGSKGKREDKSGTLLVDLIEKIDGKKDFYNIIPDNQKIIKQNLIELCDHNDIDLILTTGGTGLAPDDVTPEATLAVIEKEVPGLSEMMRQQTSNKTPLAFLSRARAGIRGNTLIINLPGSPKAVKECFTVIAKVLPHGIKILKNEIKEHNH